MSIFVSASLSALLLASAQAPLPNPQTPADVVAAAPASAWWRIAPEDLMLIELANGRRVVIQLAPAFAPIHVANIKALVRSGFFNGTAIIRAQDNYVVQWGGGDANKPLPKGVQAKPPAEYDRPLAGLVWRDLPYADPYAERTAHIDGWPVGHDKSTTWLTHCYGMIGVGRDMPPDTGTGQELYAVIGQAPRHLDRNIALVGRVIDGMDALSTRPRGSGDMGFYTDDAQKLGIIRVAIVADLPKAEQPGYEVMDTKSGPFAAYIEMRANRRDAFFVRPAGGADICNLPVPVRKSSK